MDSGAAHIFQSSCERSPKVAVWGLILRMSTNSQDVSQWTQSRIQFNWSLFPKVKVQVSSWCLDCSTALEFLISSALRKWLCDIFKEHFSWTWLPLDSVNVGSSGESPPDLQLCSPVTVQGLDHNHYGTHLVMSLQAAAMSCTVKHVPSLAHTPYNTVAMQFFVTPF